MSGKRKQFNLEFGPLAKPLRLQLHSFDVSEEFILLVERDASSAFYLLMRKVITQVEHDKAIKRICRIITREVSHVGMKDE